MTFISNDEEKRRQKNKPSKKNSMTGARRVEASWWQGIKNWM